MAEAHGTVHARNFINLAGRVFARLTAISPNGKNKHGQTLWICRCECGVVKSVLGCELRYGKATSCGCGKSGPTARRVTHGLTGTPEHIAWDNIIQRCCNPKNKGYRRYGGRGITICDRWRHDFAAFLADMGARPTPKHEIERIDNDKGYSPDNCRWATRKEQTRNRSGNRHITISGITKVLSDWAAEYGICKTTLAARLKRLSPIEALTLPIDSRRAHRRPRQQPATSPQGESA